MEDQVANELLSQVPSGEELRNPRAGQYDNAIFSEVSKSDDGSAALLKFTNLRDTEGNDFEHTLYLGFPSRSDEPWKQRQFLSVLHDIGAVPESDKNARYVESPEVADIIVQILRGFVGTSYGIKLRESKSGFLNLSFLRKKKQSN